ncbi:MAG TPA: response regulator [Methanospirillum sp.]|uniref:response regulator n=1 Tax=Methanospirillum sp. TaxID=45200 RepID=UPI002CFA57EF|nr:response regulator [Methanospirillum sp.]HOJ97045.1 response regulator [Methanospirillum sp.]HPP77827.1 response regulator [Methanospirillum sp.]
MSGILIIEDTKEDLERARDILTGSGYQVTGIAPDGESGIEKYCEISPDLVIIDLILPGMNGIDVLHAIRNENPNARIILCTSAGQGTVIDLAMRSGANGYVVKPYDPEILLSAVRRISGSPG